MSVCPGLLVKIYLQKFRQISVFITNIIINNGYWFFVPENNTIINPIAKEKNIIPIISDRPAIAWLKKPRLFIANSSVKTKSWIE